MPATINDVAKLANVSITTVSRVINDNYPVNKETKVRVENAIKELNYKPNIMARSLITKKTSVIGIVVPGLTNLFFPAIVETIEKILKESSYTIFLGNCYGNSREELKIIEDMAQRSVDGIIIIDPQIDNINKNAYKKFNKTVPIVIVGGIPSDSAEYSVIYDEEEGTREAFLYLLALGHKKIAFIRGDKSYSYDIKEKIYKEVLSKNKIEYLKIIKIKSSNSIEAVESTEDAIKNLFSGKDSPTAVFACNDLMAVGSLNACRSLNINVPEDISIIGCDDTLLSEISNPKLTSINLHMKEAGEKAASELLNIIKGNGKTEGFTKIPTNLIIKDSCDFLK